MGLKQSTWNVSLVKVEIEREMIRLDGQEILKSDSFQYLGSIIHKDEEIEGRRYGKGEKSL